MSLYISRFEPTSTPQVSSSKIIIFLLVFVLLFVLVLAFVFIRSHFFSSAAGEEELALILYIIMTSRLLEKPLSAIIQGASSSGKTFILEAIAKLMPPEEVVQAHDFTDQVFYYMEEGSLQHRVVISGERRHEHQGKDGESQDNTKAQIAHKTTEIANP